MDGDGNGVPESFITGEGDGLVVVNNIFRCLKLIASVCPSRAETVGVAVKRCLALGGCLGKELSGRRSWGGHKAPLTSLNAEAS